MPRHRRGTNPFSPMIKEIKYSGITANPSDYECPDGTIAATIGLINQNSAMTPILPSLSIMQCEEGTLVKHIHKTIDYTHYILLKKDGTMQWVDGSNTSKPKDIHSFTTEINQVTAIGNTLIVITTDGMHYFLYKDNTNYSYLGTHLPELPLSFGLQGKKAESSQFSIAFSGYGLDDTGPYYEIPEGHRDTITNKVLGQVNKFIAENYTNSKYFIYPFFVRYAYRMYDGSLTMHSAPILMVCSTDQAPYVLASKIDSIDNTETGLQNRTLSDCRVVAALHQLDFAVVKEDYITALKEWSDIVLSVDIFISAPLYSYDQSGKIEAYEKFGDDAKGDYCICKATHGGDYSTYYQYHKMGAFVSYGSSFVPGLSIKLPMKNQLNQKENIKDESTFYFLKSYGLDSLSTERKIIPIEEGYLQSLSTREVMSDDFNSHAINIPSGAYIYNSRLNIFDIKQIVPSAFHMSSLLCYTDGFLQKKADGSVDRSNEATQEVSMFVHLKKNGKNIIVRSLDYKNLGFYEGGARVGNFTPTPYLYYPDASAYKAVLFWHKWVADGEVMVFREINLEPHPMLNGAVYFKGWEETSGVETDDERRGSDSIYSRSVLLENKIYTSEVNNPFVFPASSINTVSCGRIRTVASTSKPISEGQAGLFPLYTFSDEGVWALSVSDTGTYSSKQNVTRDIIKNRESILQLDSSVLFSTDRGVMNVEGAKSTCITDIFNGSHFNTSTIIDEDKLNKLNADALPLITAVPFIDYIANCQMVYDYRGQRIVLFNPSHNYAYVYSLQSKLWGMMQSNFKEAIPYYPEAYVMTNDNKLINLSDIDEESTPPAQLLVTRPLKLDHPDKLKTITTVIQRGHFHPGHVKQILYGSRDLTHWNPIWSSTDHYLRGFTGTPYKYFRIVVIATLTKDEYLEGCTIEYDLRQTNMLR